MSRGLQSDAGRSWEVRLLSLSEPVRPLWQQLLLATATAAACTLICWPLAGFFPLAELVMVYVLGIIFASVQLGPMASAVAAVMCAACFDFFYVIPHFNFVPSDLKHLATVVGLLAVGLVISSLTTRLKHQVELARWEGSRIAALLALSRKLASTPVTDALADVAVQHVHDFFGLPVFLYLRDPAGNCVLTASAGFEVFSPADIDGLIATVEQTGLDSGSIPVTVHSEVSPDEVDGGKSNGVPAEAVCAPLRGARGHMGLLGVVIAPNEIGEVRRMVEQMDLFAAQITPSIERARLEFEAEQARVHAEKERLRSALLSSVSHDLRTPLGTITGVSSALLEDDSLLESAEGRALLATINEEANRLNRLVGNLLDMTRLEAGAVEPKKEWQPVEEVVGSLLTRWSAQLEGRHLLVELDEQLPLIQIDGVLIEQALANILENACRYTAMTDTIEIRAFAGVDRVLISIGDRGPGLPPGDETRIFDKFYRGLDAKSKRSGVGLGLAVARGIVAAHGGSVWAENRDGGGAFFYIELPLEQAPIGLEMD
ncbi:MAG: DUF4118 domain-containing protein [Actinobacteria bacterium]|nr:DUF4118 domain-containing protein [Actinomycetota bacterium]